MNQALFRTKPVAAGGYRLGLRTDQAIATGEIGVREAESEIRALVRGQAVAEFPAAANELYGGGAA